MTTTAARSTADQTVEVGHGFRPDIEGLRALTLAIIMLYHAKVPFVSGGFISVDVFFMLSGFLITGLVIREIRKTGTVGLAAFWGRRARRLLPAAGLVLFVTGVASIFLLPAVEHRDSAIDIVAAALYVANMVFIRTSTDYFAATEVPSPVLHFWTLGVEEQFYLVWPLILFAIAFAMAKVAKRRGAGEAARRLIPATLIVVGIVFVLSFILNVWLTGVAEPVAFFLMPTRAWEFAAGAMVGVAVVQLARIPQWLRTTMAWAGLAFLLWGVFTLQKTMPFPGVTALIPVVSTVLMLIGGTGGIGRGPGVIFSTRPMQAMGRMSYSWYLWHWPCLILGSIGLGLTGVWWALVLVWGSFIPAYFAYRYVETPFRNAPWAVKSSRNALLMGLGASLIGVLGGLLLWFTPVSTAVNVNIPPGPSVPGALAPIPGPPNQLTPPLMQARDDRPPSYGRCHLPVPETDSPECVFGDPEGAITVALLGDSHAGQWVAAMDAVGKERGWRIESFTKTGCPAPEVTAYLTSYKRPYSECDIWRANVLASFAGPDGPDAVMVTSIKPSTLVDPSGALVTGAGADAIWQQGWLATVRAITLTGTSAIVLHDTPTLDRDPVICVDLNKDNPAECDVPAAEAIPPTSDDTAIVSGLPGVYTADFNPGICYETFCPVVRANRMVFRDRDHLTASYSQALAPGIARILTPMVDEAAKRKNSTAG